MSIPRISNDLAVIQKLDDRPNDTDGLTPAQLKAEFDKAAGYLKTYVNDYLLPYLESAVAAADIGLTGTYGLTATNVQAAIEQIMLAMQNITQGGVAPKSITPTELDDGAVIARTIANGAVLAAALGADVDYAAIGLAANQVRPIYVQATVPTSSSPDGIYLVTGS